MPTTMPGRCDSAPVPSTGTWRGWAGMADDVTPPPAGPDPWRTLGTREVYDNAWIRVREDRVVRPDGAAGIYGVVSFKTLALGAVVRFDNDDTLLVGQHRYTVGAWSWEIPEGGAHPAAEPLAEVQRELREETGLVAARWTPLGGLHTSNSATDEAGALWLAEDLTQHAAAPARAMDGTFTDSLTIIGLCRALHLIAARGAGDGRGRDVGATARASSRPPPARP